MNVKIMGSGYPRDVFVEPVDDYLLCKLCGNVLRNPRTTPCGHVFCQGCIERWVKEYGVCPQRCRELEPQHLTWAVHIDTRISGLKTRCQNYNFGCIVQVALCEKQKHELACPFNHIVGLGASRDPQPRATGEANGDPTDRAPSSSIEKEPLGFFQRTKLVLSFRSAKSARRQTPSNANVANQQREPRSAGSMQSQRTYRLKRNRPKEPLGLVLVSGDKTRDGRYKSYYVKKVNRDTLGWRAGILAGDRIIKVDNCDLWRMTPQESVARIKEKSVILLTVVRETGGNASAKANHSHIYDEIMYSDLSQQNLSQHALSQPLPGLSFTGPGLLAQGFSQYDENYPPAPPPMDFGKYAPAAQQLKPLIDNEDSDHKPQRHLRPISPAAHLTRRTASTSGLGERTSKDSGLSSGSSDSRNHAPKQMDPQPAVTNTARLTAQEPATAQASLTTHTQDLDRDINARKSYRTQREMVRTFLKNQRRNSPAPQEPVPANQPMRSRNCRIVGNYELEDIYLEKNGTSQLGITLGYDSSAAHGGCLYVCEIVSGGLAASDGRLRTGDIIKRVNGFQVYDPEEAILLFLEQDQDITLSVARKIKMPSKLRPRAETDLDYLESTLLRDGHSMRKVDSCGSLDSHTHHDYATLEPPSDRIDEPIALQEPSRRSRDLSSLYTNSQVNVHESWKLREDDPFEDDPYHARRSSTPSRTTKHSPLSSSRQVMGSSPNLLRPTHGPRQTSLGISKCASGSNLLSTNPVTSHNGRRRTSSQDRPTSSTPDSKHYRPLGGVVRNQRKRSTPSPVGTPITPLDHEPRIMVPPSPTQVPPSFRGLAHEIRRLPNRFENNSLLDPSTAVTHIRRESLV